MTQLEAVRYRRAVLLETSRERLKAATMSGQYWPEPSEMHLRRLLRDMRIDADDIQEGEFVAVKDVFARALASIQGLSSSSRRFRQLDPQSWPRLAEQYSCSLELGRNA